jgi:hypothetical protein
LNTSKLQPGPVRRDTSPIALKHGLFVVPHDDRAAIRRKAAAENSLNHLGRLRSAIDEVAKEDKFRFAPMGAHVLIDRLQHAVQFI